MNDISSHLENVSSTKLNKIYNELKVYNQKLTNNYNDLIDEILIFTKRNNILLKNQSLAKIEKEV